MFRTVPLSIARSFSLYTQQWYVSYTFADSLRAGSGWNWIPSWSCLQAVRKPVWHIPLLYVQLKTPDDGQRNCPKHIEFQSNNTSSGVSHCTYSNNIWYTGFLTVCEQDQDGTQSHPNPTRKLSANMYDIYHRCMYSERLLMMDRGTVRNIQSFDPRINLRY